MIKLTKEYAGYYTYKHYTIEKEECHLGGSQNYWYCDQLAKNKPFRTLKGIKLAIELKEKNELSRGLLEECSDI
jgi:hypothetical protein